MRELDNYQIQQHIHSLPRKRKIWLRKEKGETLISIAKDYGITKQRVKQLVESYEKALGL